MTWEVRQGDSALLLKEIPENSVSLVACDPPYGIHFMGLAFDKNLPDPAIWRECLRVLKPGASAVVMSGSRLDCLWRMCRDLEEAGFELQTSALFWVTRSGFPKGQHLSKAADARAQAQRPMNIAVARAMMLIGNMKASPVEMTIIRTMPYW